MKKLDSLDPTEEDKKIADAVINFIPGLGVITTIGNSIEMAKLLLIRIIVFGLLFFHREDILTTDIKNPYFLVVISSVSLVALHIAYITGGHKKEFLKELAKSSFIAGTIAGIFFGAISLIFLFLLGSEVMLLAHNWRFFLIDITIGAIWLIVVTDSNKK